MSVNGKDVTWDNLDNVLKAVQFQRQVSSSLTTFMWSGLNLSITKMTATHT